MPANGLSKELFDGVETSEVGGTVQVFVSLKKSRNKKTDNIQ
jgi:hypothetical protein